MIVSDTPRPIITVKNIAWRWTYVIVSDTPREKITQRETHVKSPATTKHLDFLQSTIQTETTKHSESLHTINLIPNDISLPRVIPTPTQTREKH